MKGFFVLINCPHELEFDKDIIIKEQVYNWVEKKLKNKKEDLNELIIIDNNEDNKFENIQNDDEENKTNSLNITKKWWVILHVNFVLIVNFLQVWRG